MKTTKMIFKGLLLTLTVIFFSSCASVITTRSGQTTSFYPTAIRFDLTSNDFELIGEMDISVKYSQYLGIIKIYELINDKEVSKRNIYTMDMYGKYNLNLSPMLFRALYDVYVKYPDADFTIPSYIIDETEKLFMGKKIRKTARIRVYKLKI
jgi:hypothetical protein